MSSKNFPTAPSAQESITKQTSQTHKSRNNLAVNVGAALLWPAFATGSLVFGINEEIEPSGEPFKSQFQPIEKDLPKYDLPKAA